MCELWRCLEAYFDTFGQIQAGCVSNFDAKLS